MFSGEPGAEWTPQKKAAKKKSGENRTDQIQWTGAWNPTPLLTVEFSGEYDRGRLQYALRF
jgi:hypothetical protein